MVGLPVFAGFKGGFGALFGMTGGYIMGFILQAAVFWLFEVFFGRKLWSEMVSMVLGLVACYAFGTVWFMLVYSGKNGPISLMSALGMCVFPFVLIDVAKMLVAVTLGKTLRKAFHMQ
jgi:biotin transport system substrate-specific component